MGTKSKMGTIKAKWVYTNIEHKKKKNRQENKFRQGLVQGFIRGAGCVPPNSR